MEQPAPSPEPVPYDAACRRIQVSREKRPLNFFVTLSKKFLTTDDVVELSGLGLAVTTVVTIAEILKSSGFVSLEHIQTSLVEPHPDGHTTAPKAKIQIWIRKTPQFDSLMTNHNSHNTRVRGNGNAATATDAHLEAGNTNPTADVSADDEDVTDGHVEDGTESSGVQTGLHAKS